jgi:hypothetical protein
MIKRLITQLGLAAAMSLLCMNAFGALVNGSFTITSATVLNIYSTTLDGACTPSPVGDFFSCSPDSPPGAALSITDVNVGTNPGSGTLSVQYDNATGEITQVNDMIILLRDMDITIAGATPTLITIRNGNGVPGAGDVTTIHSGTGTTNGTADPDEDSTFNTGASLTKFQHDDAPKIDAPDFSAFTAVVDTCVGPLCALIPLLALDGVRYEIEGTVSGLGGDTFTLTTETGNSSSYEVAFTTAVVPVPAAVWLFGSALGLLGWIRRRQTN